jgi:peptide/nickel transport system substrate-binding protein
MSSEGNPSRGILFKGTAATVSLLVVFLFLNLASAQPTSYQEAPNFAELVDAGDLPPVDERLPAKPRVIEPVERIGEYGGTWRMGLVGGADTPWLIRTLAYENLVNWNVDWTGVIPNIAESFEVNEDSTEFTFHLREGMKWSDGEPFTANDILFWYEDVLMNEELTPAVPTWVMSGGEPVVVEAVDDVTVRFSFQEPNGLFLNNLALPDNAVVTLYPRHYMERFHADYNTTDLDDMVAREGAADWVQLFQNKADIHAFSNGEKPVLYAWRLTTPYGAGTRVVAERNPYYWKVDIEGNQLPYIDQLVYNVLEDAEVLLLQALNGEIDMYDRHIANLTNRAILADNMEEGEYHFFDLVPAGGNAMVLFLNWNANDPVKREIFQNKEFRIGLSHAIDRQEIIDLIYLGLNEPSQVAPRSESNIYDEEMAKQYTEYSVERANEHLDAAGYTERDAQGFRLGPDGNRISFTVEVTAAIQQWVDAIQLIQADFEEVGIEMEALVADRALVWERMQAGEQDAMIWGGEGGLYMDALMGPYSYFPYSIYSKFAPYWSNWYQGAEPAEEPPADVQRQMELYDELQATADADEQLRLMTEILATAKEKFYHIGIATQPPGYGLVKNNFYNVPESMAQAGLYPNPAPTMPEQFFIETGN